MNILLDYQIWLLQRYGGISRYFLGLSSALSTLGDDVTIFAPFNINVPASRSQFLKRPSIFLPRYSTKFRADRIATGMSSLGTQFYLKKWQPDVVHQTFFGGEYRIPFGVPRAITVYDMIREINSSDKQISLKKRVAIENADAIICISENTKIDLLNYLNIDEKLISVVPLSADDFFYTPMIRKNSHEKPFILYVGQRSGYKNFDLLLRAFASLERLNKEFDLHVFGGGAFTDYEKALISELKLVEQVKKIDGSDDILKSEYLGAEIFVYPSKYEGFGIPILEAMAVGCPVITSNVSSMPEVAGDAAFLFDPLSKDHLMNAIEEVITSDTLRRTLSLKGTENASKYSWMETARKTREVYGGLTNEN